MTESRRQKSEGGLQKAKTALSRAAVLYLRGFDARQDNKHVE
jgi:hypothetical protein